MGKLGPYMGGLKKAKGGEIGTGDSRIMLSAGSWIVLLIASNSLFCPIKWFCTSEVKTNFLAKATSRFSHTGLSACCSINKANSKSATSFAALAAFNFASIRALLLLLGVMDCTKFSEPLVC